MELLYPVTNVILTQGFGENPEYYADESQHPGWRWPGHNGLDFGGSLGSPGPGAPILAAAAGIVTRAAFEKGGYGHYVRLTHDNGWLTYYAHLSRLDVRLDQRLAAGQVLGAMGDSGCAFGVHLHFGLRSSSSGRLPPGAAIPGAAIPGAPAGYAGYADPAPYFLPPAELVEAGDRLDSKNQVLPIEPLPSTGSGSGRIEGIGVISIPPQGRARVCVDVLNVRAAPGLDAVIVGALYAGALFSYDGVTIQDDVAWLSFAGLHAAALYKGARYVAVVDPF